MSEYICRADADGPKHASGDEDAGAAARHWLSNVLRRHQCVPLTAMVPDAFRHACAEASRGTSSELNFPLPFADQKCPTATRRPATRWPATHCDAIHIADADGPLPLSPPARKSSPKLMRRCLLALAHAAWPQPSRSVSASKSAQKKLSLNLDCLTMPPTKGPSLHLLDVLYPSKPRCDLLHLGSRAVEPHGQPRIPAAKLPALGPFRARLPTPDPRTAIVLS